MSGFREPLFFFVGHRHCLGTACGAYNSIIFIHVRRRLFAGRLSRRRRRYLSRMRNVLHAMTSRWWLGDPTSATVDSEDLERWRRLPLPLRRWRDIDIRPARGADPWCTIYVTIMLCCDVTSSVSNKTSSASDTAMEWNGKTGARFKELSKVWNILQN